MNTRISTAFAFSVLFMLSGCSTAYEAKPLPFQLPSTLGNAVSLEKAQMGARAFTETKEAEELFGFDVLGAGLLPVQVTFDNQGDHSFQIKTSQTFLVSNDGSLWPILDWNTVYERSSKYAGSKKIMSEGAYKGLLGAAAGGVIGAAVGIVSGENVAEATGKGAAIGAAAGLTLGGLEGYASDEPSHRIKSDLSKKSLENKDIPVNAITYGYLFFPVEAKTARRLRMQLEDLTSKKTHTLFFDF